MANLFNRDRNNKKNDDKGSIWSTLGSIAIAGLYVAAAVAADDPEYNSAVEVMKTIVPKYDGLRRTQIPASDWDKMSAAEKVFEKNANLKDDAISNASKIHMILLSNHRKESTPHTATRVVVVEERRPINVADHKMSCTEAQSVYNIYMEKYKWQINLAAYSFNSPRLALTDSECQTIFQAATVLRENKAPYKANELEKLLSYAI